jgi:hypothetical protein
MSADSCTLHALWCGDDTLTSSRCLHAHASQAITWLYTANLPKAQGFLQHAVGLKEVFNGGGKAWTDCGVWEAPGSNHAFFLGLCNNGRPPPTSLNEAAVTITLVLPSRTGVDTWHTFLSSAPVDTVNLTTPSFSKEYDCYAFNFYDTDPEGLGNYRFEVQVFEDPAWPSAPPTTASPDGDIATPPTPQQVTWLYTSDLPAADTLITTALGYIKVLTQTTCYIYQSSSAASSAWFVGVCNSRPPPTADFAPVTYSVIVPNKTQVTSSHTAVARYPSIVAAAPAEVPKYNIFGFDFNGVDHEILGGYRFNVQTFNDPEWPQYVVPKATCGQSCSSDSDCDPNQPCNHCERLILGQCVT